MQTPVSCIQEHKDEIIIYYCIFNAPLTVLPEK